MCSSRMWSRCALRLAPLLVAALAPAVMLTAKPTAAQGQRVSRIGVAQPEVCSPEWIAQVKSLSMHSSGAAAASGPSLERVDRTGPQEAPVLAVDERRGLLANQGALSPQINTIPNDPEFGGVTPRRLISHSFHRQHPTSHFGEDRSEYFTLRDGKRLSDVKNDSRQTEPRKSNPEVIRIITETVRR